MHPYEVIHQFQSVFETLHRFLCKLFISHEARKTCLDKYFLSYFETKPFLKWVYTVVP